MGLRLKLILPVILSLGIFSIVIHFVWFKGYVEESRTEFEQHQLKILSTLTHTLTRSVLSRDLEAVYSTLDWQMDNMSSSWLSLSLFDTQGKRLYPLDATTIPQQEHVLEINHQISYAGKDIALAKLLVDWQPGFQNASTYKHQVEIIALLIFILVTIITLVWQNKWILNPLISLEKAALKLKQGDYNEPLPRISNDELGHLTQAFAVMRDEHKHARSQLEKRVAERTRELVQEKSRAEEANKAKSQFLSSMSHELRTPLNAIIGFGQILEMQSKQHNPKKSQEFISHILQSGYHLLNLINEILDLSRIEAGHLEIQPEAVPLKQVVTECITQIDAGVAKQFKVNLENHIDDAKLMILADSRRIKQVLINLLNNAAKYNREGGSVIVRAEPAAEGRLRILVSDSGIGIAADDMDKLFDPFERLSKKNSHIEGTGIGLTVTRQLIEAMDGSIGVESVLNQGSTFWVELPLSTGKDRLEQTPAKAIAERPEPEACKHRILYIEDNPSNTHVVLSALKQRGNYEVFNSQTAEQGLTLAEEKIPALILMDINLPGMSGIAALKILRNLETTRNIPVIAVSANAMGSEIQAGHEAGFDDYLTKPIDIQRLYSTIEKHLIPSTAA